MPPSFGGVSSAPSRAGSNSLEVRVFRARFDGAPIAPSCAPRFARAKPPHQRPHEDPVNPDDPDGPDDPDVRPNFQSHACSIASLNCDASDSIGIVRCRVCLHASRAQIEDACDHSTPSLVASRFGLSAIALERHLSSHRAWSPVVDEPPATSRSPLFVRSVADLIPESARRTIFAALERHPEAAKDVRDALARVEAAA